jgi:hypothetical protein
VSADDKTADRIRAWLLDQKYSVADTSEQGKAFVLIANESHETGFGFGVSQEIGKPRVVALALTLPLDIYQQHLSGNPQERYTFLRELRLKLIEFDVEFNLPLDFTSVMIAKHIYLDGLNEDSFWRHVHEVRRAMLAIVWMLEQKFSIPFSDPRSFNVTTQ